MSKSHGMWLLRLIALALLLIGVAVWFSGGLDVPARRPPKRFYFGGASAVLLGLAPSLLGAAVYWVSDKPHEHNGKVVGYVIGAAFAAAALAFFLCEVR